MQTVITSQKRPCIAALDQGTTSTRCLILDAASGRVLGVDQRPLPLAYPEPGWVEQDPDRIVADARAVLAGALRSAARDPGDLAAIGITNQRETVVVWERATGRPVAPAIVWQDRRTASVCDRLRADGFEDRVRERTGLPLDPYFSATKIAWILDHVPGLRARAGSGEIAAGTIDAWLLWNLTDGRIHATDATNASRTQLLDLKSLTWSDELCEIFDVPSALLPEVRPSAGPTPFGFCGGAPITAILGDQHAALVGQAAFTPGDVKNTYGTGSFLLMNAGTAIPRASRHGLLATLAYQWAGEPPVYALEGSVFTTGAAIQWLRDGLGILASAGESEALARSVPDSGGVVFVPALSGMGAPYWDADARGAIFGITRGTTRAHLVRATLEAIAHQTRDVVDAMRADCDDAPIASLRVDGGAAANDFLCQFQADLLGVPVLRPRDLERTALGAGRAAGWAAGSWDLRGGIADEIQTFTPSLSSSDADARHDHWKSAVQRTLTHSNYEPR